VIQFIVVAHIRREYEYTREQLEGWYPPPRTDMSDFAYAEWLFRMATTDSANGGTVIDVIDATDPTEEYENEAELTDWALVEDGSS